MSSNKVAGFTIAIFLLLNTAGAAFAQVTQDRSTTPQATSKTLGTNKQNAVPCSTFLTGCQNTLKNRNDQITALEQELLGLSEEVVRLRQTKQEQWEEIARLRPQAALPTCSGGGEVWLHPTIPTVVCRPYVCGATPFSCKRSCSTKLDCADGLSCTADGLCLPPPKQK